MAANHLHLLLCLALATLVSLDFSCAQTGITSLSPLKADAGAGWSSPSGRFSFGFYATEGGLAVGVLLATAPNVTITWTANRNDTATRGTLRLADDGRLLWTGAGDHDRTVAQPSRPAVTGAMRDDGNFVLFGADDTVVWQTFESPTDTLVAGQDLMPAAQLFSSLSDINKAAGKYRLVNQQEDDNLVLYPVSTPNDPASSYWNTGTFDLGFTLILRLDTSGLLYLVNNDGSFTKNLTRSRALKAGEQAYYRLTLDPDGVLRLYRHTSMSGGATNTTTVIWSALTDRCVHGVCGHNSYCVLDQDRPSCLCPPGFDFLDASNAELGCTVNSSAGDCKGGQQQDAADFFVKSMPNMEWADITYDAVSKATSAPECVAACMADCLCVAVLRDTDKGTCSKQQLPLRYGRAGDRYTMFVKTAGAVTGSSGTHNKPVGRTTIIVLVCIGILACVALSAFIASGWLLNVKRRAVLRNVAPANASADDGEGLEEEEAAPLRLYTYQELEHATYCFRDPVGRGAFGTVFKGALRNGEQAIAVKRLEKLVEDGEEEFQREVRAIGRTSHRNLVRLLGFCHEGAHRLLVYEFMSNGSVTDLLFRGAASTPPWSDRLGIVLDVARGLHYLHDELSSRVIHYDIKPQNILIDAAGTAKIADFGLAKLLQPDTHFHRCPRHAWVPGPRVVQGHGPCHGED
ncbi:hypothetical protein VPH35_103541 [Triticum aestivum]